MTERHPLQDFIDKLIEDNKEELMKARWDLSNYGTSVTMLDKEGKLVRVDPKTINIEKPVDNTFTR